MTSCSVSLPELSEDKATATLFSLPVQLTAEQYVALADEVVELALLLFAPAGVSRAFDLDRVPVLEGAPREQLVQALQEPWQRLLDAVAEATYRRHGVSEGIVALSAHSLIEEQRDPAVMAAMRRTQVKERARHPLMSDSSSICFCSYSCSSTSSFSSPFPPPTAH